MNYSALIENRKSVRAFTDKEVPAAILEQIQDYYTESCRSLDPSLETELVIVGDESKQALEGAAGYNQFLVGAPQYLVLLSEKGKLDIENAGYMMQDLILKLTDLDLDTCWLTYTDSNAVKAALGIHSDLEVAALAAFGYGQKTTKRLRLNILSMSNVDIKAQRRYFEPKKGILDLVFLNKWGNTHKLEEHIGFFDDMLWEAFRAVSLSPSYLNRQAYGFVVSGGNVSLVAAPDVYTTELDGRLSQGIALLHFTAVAEQWSGKITWNFSADSADLELPEGYRVIASCSL